MAYCDNVILGALQTINGVEHALIEARHDIQAFTHHPIIIVTPVLNTLTFKVNGVANHSSNIDAIEEKVADERGWTGKYD